MNFSGFFDKKYRLLIINGILGVLLIIITSYLPEKISSPSPPELQKAAKIMYRSLELISEYCRINNINNNEITDPYKSGLIGPEVSEIMTTIGHLDAKRTTINPNFAALIVYFLLEAGVNKGDTIALACSGSFPALMIASLSAVKVLELNPRVILSMGASSFGASNINLTILDIYNLLLDNNIIDSKPVAISLGGEKDIGEEFEKDVINILISKIKSKEIPFIYEKELQSNVFTREAFYCTDNNIDIKAFINAGGGFVNMGTSPLSLKIPPGLVKNVRFPERSKDGMIFYMLRKNIPVIHLLFIKGISQKYGLAWDPSTIPEINNNSYNFFNRVSPVVPVISIMYLIYFCLILIRYKKLNNIS